MFIDLFGREKENSDAWWGEVSEGALGEYGRLALEYESSDGWNKYVDAVSGYYGGESILRGVGERGGDKGRNAYAKLLDIEKKYDVSVSDLGGEIDMLLATSPRMFEAWQTQELKEGGLDLKTFIEKSQGSEFLGALEKQAAVGGAESGQAQSEPSGTACVAGLPEGDPALNLRSEPSASAKVIQQLTSGTVMSVLGQRGNWNHVQVIFDGKEGAVGWISSKFSQQVEAPEECAKFLP